MESSLLIITDPTLDSFEFLREKECSIREDYDSNIVKCRLQVYFYLGVETIPFDHRYAEDVG